ncbi:MAG: multimeric flavodoxin WrbA [Deltaproteobacteria bacterium]|nr:multimeric flavodoxin WrbA [Deltaproteobacteria bacterium]
MKVLGILGSPRVGGNSDILLEQALAGAKNAGAEVEKIVLSKKKISGCLDCGKCNETGICAIKDDMLEIHQRVLEADAIIHSVPVYFWAMTSQMKAYLDRWCVFFDAEWQWQKAYRPKMKGKSTCQFSGLNLIGVVQASASTKGEIAKNEGIKKQAYDLGRKSVTG